MKHQDNQIQLWSKFFEDEDKVNIVQLEDSSFWFQFSHLCKILGYTNPTVALQTHCEEYEIQKFDIGLHEDVNFVSESGFYSLVLGSNKPKAKFFKKWVCTKVLPKLRATGLATVQMSNESVAEYNNRVAELESVNQEHLIKIDKLERNLTYYKNEFKDVDAEMQNSYLLSQHSYLYYFASQRVVSNCVAYARYATEKKYPGYHKKRWSHMSQKAIKKSMQEYKAQVEASGFEIGF